MSTLAAPPRSPALNLGNILLSVDGGEIVPPEHPVFPMGKQTSVVIVDNEDKQRTVSVDVARPKGKKLHFIEPTLVESRRLGDGIGYLKVAMFPGMVGVVVANQISSGIASLGDIDRLIIDLRGNTGGGIGALRVMSLLTPDKIPVGFALDRRRANAKIEAEKLTFPRFSRIPALDKESMAARTSICSIDACEKAYCPRNRRTGPEAVPRKDCAARESPYGKRRRNDCRLRP